MNHNHENDCNCNDNHNHDCDCCHEHHQTITLTLDNDKEVNCEVISVFNLNKQDYIALLPEDEEEVFLYRFQELETNQIEISNIESEEEYKSVAEEFYSILDDNFDLDDEE